MGHKLIIGSQVFEYDNYEDYLDAMNQFKDPISENISDIEIAIDKIVSENLDKYWYTNLSELSLIAITPESIWYNEANEIKKWYNHVYENLYQYKNTVDKNNIVQLDQFISDLPQLTIEQNGKS